MTPEEQLTEAVLAAKGDFEAAFKAALTAAPLTDTDWGELLYVLIKRRSERQVFSRYAQSSAATLKNLRDIRRNLADSGLCGD